MKKSKTIAQSIRGSVAVPAGSHPDLTMTKGVIMIDAMKTKKRGRGRPRKNQWAAKKTNKLNCIEFIESQKLGFHLGNAIECIIRGQYKKTESDLVDLKKAIWYIQRDLDKVKEHVSESH